MSLASAAAASSAVKRARPWSARGVLLLALLLAGVAGCGRQGPPQPELSAPPVQVRAWQRDGEALVSWRLPDKKQQERHGGLEGFRLLIERLPPRCFHCPPEDERLVRLRVDVPPLQVESRVAFYHFSLPVTPSLWRFRVATVYDDGTTPPSVGVLLEAPAEVPMPVLLWEWAEPPRAPGEARRLRLHWEAHRERMVRVIGKEQTMVEQERLFRANLYRRREEEPWSLRPFNARPLEARQVVLALAQREPPAEEEEVPDWEFTLRLVDQFGNEGPPAPTVAIPAIAGTP